MARHKSINQFSIDTKKEIFNKWLGNPDKPITRLAEDLKIRFCVVNSIITTGLAENWANHKSLK
jgi:hypothetical protein